MRVVILYKATEWLGFLGVLSSVSVLLVSVISGQYSESGLIAIAFNCAMLTVVAAALIYTSRQRAAATEIGYKTYPASLVALVLWVFIFLRWYAESA